jgi:lipopolysaccharide transport system ATP-binding protein
MARDSMVKVEGLGKRYRLGEFEGLPWNYGTLAEAIGRTLKLRGRGAAGADSEQEIWAVRDVNLEVSQGEALGLIGHNGAGKSTVLKMLSRVTPPTEGTIRLRGRVATLLEVGTGFQFELTGRENVFLNGAILGMRRAEIARKFDEIVEFAEVEKFIDTPVKRYSSGMFLRLGFAVAAHLEPEVLIVDEVLAVGDLAFQRKCLSRMESVAREGRTVIFVSHNLASVRSLCTRCVVLAAGRKVLDGPTEEVIDEYVSTAAGGDSRILLSERTDRTGSGRLRIQEAALEKEGEPIDSPATGETFSFSLRYETADGRPLRGVRFTIQVQTLIGQALLDMDTASAGVATDQIPAVGEVRCTLPRCPLPAGEYTVTLGASRGDERLDWIDRAMQLTVRHGDFFGTGRPSDEERETRSVLVEHRWLISSERGAMDEGVAPAVFSGSSRPSP